MKKLTVVMAGLVLMALGAVDACAEANADKDVNVPVEVKEFTSVVNDLVAGFEAITKAADGETAAEPVKEIAKEGEKAAAAQEAKTPRQRALKNSAILIAGGAGLGASVGKMTGKKNAMIIGAIAGAVAGVIYDRATYKNPKGI
jgi:outer membrane lipoprotein SlyB